MSVHRAIVKGHLGGVVAIRSMFTANVTLAEGDTTVDMFEAYIMTVIDEIRSYLHSSWTTETIEVQAYISNEWFTVIEEPFTYYGGGGGDAIANLVAAVMVGTLSLFHAHGRKFWSGLTEAAVDGNSLTGSAVAAFATACANYVAPYTSLNGGSLVPGIVGKDHNFHAFVGGFVSSLLGSMRRRKPGVGM